LTESVIIVPLFPFFISQFFWGYLGLGWATTNDCWSSFTDITHNWLSNFSLLLRCGASDFCASGRCSAALIKSVEHIVSRSPFVWIVQLSSQTVSARTVADVSRVMVKTVTNQLVIPGLWNVTPHKCYSWVSTVSCLAHIL